jgi:hypothetical protein
MEFAHMLGWIAGLQSLVNTNNVPFAASHGKTELTFIFKLGKRQRTFEDQVSAY